MKKLALLIAFTVIVGAAMPVLAQSGYAVDANHSNVGFSVPILNGVSRVRGKFTDFTVNVDYNEVDLTKSSVTAIIKTTSIDTGVEARDRHLRTADFFEVEKYPDITFHSTQIEKRGKDFVAVGNFTMHGATKEISIPFVANGKFVNEANKVTMVGFTGTISLDRRDYGISYQHAQIPNWIGYDVQVELTVLLRTQPPKQN